MLPWMSARSSCVVIASSRPDHAWSLGGSLQVRGPMIPEKLPESPMQHLRGRALVIDREAAEFLLQVEGLEHRAQVRARRLRERLRAAAHHHPVGERYTREHGDKRHD